MDAIDNLIYATLRRPLTNGAIASDYLPLPFGPFVPVNTTPAGISGAVYSFSVANKMTYTSFADTSVIERAVTRHWYDVNNLDVYNWPTGVGPDLILSDFRATPTYHLIFSYLIENTRILQIFERVIERYLQDETIGITDQAQVYQWILNTEKLFFKDDCLKATNIRSLIRPSYDANRRNAYYRMFGMDLAFGDINSSAGSTMSYHKASTANQQFIPLFERYLSEVWQGYINARNTSCENSSDVNNLRELATQIQELLWARRGQRPGGAPNIYSSTNLSYEEFSSAILLTWFTFIVSDNTPVINFLNCQSTTIGERLIKVGNKVGIPAHTKCQALFEMAGPCSNILTLLEAGNYLDNAINLQTMLSSLNPGTPPSPDSDIMNAFLIVINNWEKATGHRIKNPEATLNGTVKVEPKQTKPALALN